MPIRKVATPEDVVAELNQVLSRKGWVEAD
jgi:hypothetical protein